MKALVTGAAQGIGAAIATRLRADGMEVVTLDRDEGCDLRVDVARDDLPALDDVDVCVSNAAITDTVAPAHRMTAQQWERDLAVNLSGAFRVVQSCLTGMRERGYGRIVVISSGAARGGLPGQVAYAASKAGLLGMVKTLAAENVRARDHRQRRAARAGRDREGARDAARRARARHGRAAGGPHGRAGRGRRAGRLPRLRATPATSRARRWGSTAACRCATMSLGSQRRER